MIDTIVVEYRKILFKTLFKFEVIANIHLNEANRFICKIYHNRKDYLFKGNKEIPAFCASFQSFKFLSFLHRHMPKKE